MPMETRKTFTGSSPPKFRWNKKEILWLVSVWIAFIIWSYIGSTFFPVIIVAVLSIVAILIRLPGLETKTCIKIGDETLSIHSEDAVLWRTDLKGITSIELEENERAFTSATNKALLIRNDKNDSYFLPLDGMTFEGFEPDELVEQLNQFIR